LRKYQVSLTVLLEYDSPCLHSPAKGIDIKSKKHGDIPGWKPDRGRPFEISQTQRKPELIRVVVKSIQEAADRAYKYVLITTKALPDINPTPQILSPLLSTNYASQHPSPTFVILQNGLGVEKDLYSAIRLAWSADEPRILSAAVYIQANLVGGRDVVEQGPFVSFMICLGGLGSIKRN
jgi:2-dehydropantoate 2-reductase